MMDKMEQFRQMKQMAQNPAESEQVQALVSVLVELEHRQLEALEELQDAADTEIISHEGDRDERREQLLGLVDATAGGSVRDHWFETVAPAHMNNAEEAKPYAGLSDEGWESQMETWADMYRERAPAEFDAHSDREIASHHVGEMFDVSLEVFEREVIGWSRQDALRGILAGNFEAVETGISGVATELEGGE